MLNLSRGRRGFLSLLTGLLLSISPLNTADAGLIPWTYNAIFGYGPMFPYANSGYAYGGYGAPYYGTPSYYSAPIQSFPSTSFYGGGFDFDARYPGIIGSCGCDPCNSCNPCSSCDPCGAGGCPGGICGTIGTPTRGDQSGPAPTEAPSNDASPPTYRRDPPTDEFGPTGPSDPVPPNQNNSSPGNFNPRDMYRNTPLNQGGQGTQPDAGATSGESSNEGAVAPFNFNDGFQNRRPAPAEPSTNLNSPFQPPLQREERMELKPAVDPMEDLEPSAEAPRTITRQRVVMQAGYRSLAISPVKPTPSPIVNTEDARLAGK